MQRLLSILLLCLFVVPNTAAAQDAKAKSILENASKKMNTLKSLKANFTLKLLGKTNVARETQKGVLFMKGAKYHIVLPKQEIICDGKTVWTYLKDAREVQVSNYDPEEQSISPTKLFSNFYDKEYNYRYIGQRTTAKKLCNLIEMTPKQASKQFTKAELAFAKDNTIAGGIITEKNGNRYAYEVGTLAPNISISDAEFSFNATAHPGVELVDLR